MKEPNRNDIREMRLTKIKQLLCDSKTNTEERRLLYAIGLGILELIESQKNKL